MQNNNQSMYKIYSRCRMNVFKPNYKDSKRNQKLKYLVLIILIAILIYIIVYPFLLLLIHNFYLCLCILFLMFKPYTPKCAYGFCCIILQIFIFIMLFLVLQFFLLSVEHICPHLQQNPLLILKLLYLHHLQQCQLNLL